MAMKLLRLVALALSLSGVAEFSEARITISEPRMLVAASPVLDIKARDVDIKPRSQLVLHYVDGMSRLSPENAANIIRGHTLDTKSIDCSSVPWFKTSDDCSRGH